MRSSRLCLWGYRRHFFIEATSERRSRPESDCRDWSSWGGVGCRQLKEGNENNLSVWIHSSFSGEICGFNRLPGTVQSASETATDLDPHQLRLRSLLHTWAPLGLCILWQTPPTGESGKRGITFDEFVLWETSVSFHLLAFFTTLTQELFCSLGAGQSDRAATGIWNKS